MRPDPCSRPPSGSWRTWTISPCSRVTLPVVTFPAKPTWPRSTTPRTTPPHALPSSRPRLQTSSSALLSTVCAPPYLLALLSCAEPVDQHQQTQASVKRPKLEPQPAQAKNAEAGEVRLAPLRKAYVSVYQGKKYGLPSHCPPASHLTVPSAHPRVLRGWVRGEARQGHRADLGPVAAPVRQPRSPPPLVLRSTCLPIM